MALSSCCSGRRSPGAYHVLRLCWRPSTRAPTQPRAPQSPLQAGGGAAPSRSGAEAVGAPGSHRGQVTRASTMRDSGIVLQAGGCAVGGGRVEPGRPTALCGPTGGSRHDVRAAGGQLRRPRSQRWRWTRRDARTTRTAASTRTRWRPRWRPRCARAWTASWRRGRRRAPSTGRPRPTRSRCCRRAAPDSDGVWWRAGRLGLGTSCRCRALLGDMGHRTGAVSGGE